MRKFLLAGILSVMAVLPNAVRANVLEHDSSDPLYMLANEEVLSQTGLTFWDNDLRLGQGLSFGMTDRFTVGANVHYQIDFNGEEDGFSAVDLGGIYRLARADDNNSNVISDLLVGLKVGGSSHVRTPYYADSSYYLGLRFGRQWAGVTLAATVKSTWVFDDERGVAFIDFMPEAYFRIAPDWRMGANFTMRKATHKMQGIDFDQEWLGGKIVRQFGRTQYIGHLDYEFEADELQVGAKLNIIF